MLFRSLLNISTRVPPEILGFIFSWNVIPEGGFAGLQKGSYNFLLVCHHWSEVAYKTPELWSFWGTTLEQWSKRCQRSGAAPLDLVLDGYHTGYIDVSLERALRGPLRDHAASNSIRSIRLQGLGINTPALRFVISSLIPDGNGVRRSSIESVTVYNVDFSDFLTRHDFPMLRHLHLTLSGRAITPPWDHLRVHTTALTTLSLAIGHTSPAPTASQLLSILTSNPRLRVLDIWELMTIPHDNDNGSTFRVPLHHLKKLKLVGDVRFPFGLLRWLDLPETLDKTNLTLFDCQVEEVSDILGPYLGNFLQRDGRFRDGLGISVAPFCDSVSIKISTVGGADAPALRPGERLPFATFTATLKQELPPDAQDKLRVDFIAYVPTQYVMCFKGKMSTRSLQEMIPTMPNIQELHLLSVKISDGFLRPFSDCSPANTKLLPSLRFLHLEDIIMDDNNWNPLISYLTHQTSGGQALSLRLTGEPIHVCSHVVETIKNLVAELVLDLALKQECPFGVCRKEGVGRLY